MTDTVSTPDPSENNSIRDVLPDWVREKLSKANDEAAKYRTQLRAKEAEAETAQKQVESLSDEKIHLSTQVQELTARAEKAEQDLLRIQIALDAGVPGERVRQIAERLVGSTEDELREDAKRLVEDFGLANAPRSPAFDHSQGRTGGNPVSNDPASIFAGYIKKQFEAIKR